MERPLPTLDRGDGPPVVLFPGFGLGRTAYERVVDHLAGIARVVLLDLFPGDQRWSAPEMRERILRTMDEHGLGSATFLSHSFGTGLAMELTARHPDRVEELVISDSVALDSRWVLTRNWFRGFDIARLVTVRAAVDYLSTAIGHPLQLARAAWWAFFTTRTDDMQDVGRNAVPVHMLWAERDTLLRRSDGLDVADRLEASFHVVTSPTVGGPLDHDWIFRYPELAPDVLGMVCDRFDEPADSPAVLLRRR